MSEGRVHYSKANGVASVVFDRPEARNAMTWAMYEGLYQACEQADSGDGPGLWTERAFVTKEKADWTGR